LPRPGQFLYDVLVSICIIFSGKKSEIGRPPVITKLSGNGSPFSSNKRSSCKTSPKDAEDVFSP
jgi:hypothetical protein